MVTSSVLFHIAVSQDFSFFASFALLCLIQSSSVCSRVSMREIVQPVTNANLSDHPRVRAQRTLTLIAKALQTLSNLSTFGNKEPWMEPMNAFLSTHRQEFKAFVDSICGISHDRGISAIPPSYATPTTILGRLAPTSREGFPSLPYLIDQTKELASLVSLWVTYKDKVALAEASGEALNFDILCEDLVARTNDCLSQAEQAERPSGQLEVKWEELVQHMDNKGSIGSQEPRPHQGVSRAPLASLSRLGNHSTAELALPSPNSDFSPRDSSCSRPLSLYESGSRSRARSFSEAAPENSSPGSASGVWDPGTHYDGDERSSGGTTSGRSFPPHALHWNDNDDENDGDMSPTSLEVESGSLREAEASVPPSPRDRSGNRRVDVWRLRRKRGGAGGAA